MITKLIELLKEIKGLKSYTLTLLFIIALLYIFNSTIIRAIDLTVFNKDVVSSSLKNDILINRSLKEFMENTDSDRAYIFRFHNGVTYYNGSHKSKMSCDYEVVARGVSREAEMLQDIPTALYADWIMDVVNHNMIVSDVNSIEDINVRSTLKAQEIKGIAVLPYYRHGNLFALIGVDYLKPSLEKDAELFERNRDSVIQSLKIKVNAIGNLLI
jgi:hypothetical protein